MNRFFAALLDAVYPQNTVCAICSNEALLDKHGLCAACAALLKPAQETDKLEYLDDIYCAVHYTKHMAAAIHNFKYNDARYLYRFLASLMELPKDWAFDCIVPIPLHPSKKRKRGYNQSTLIARELCGKYNSALDETLVSRVVNTDSQRTLDREERAKNIKGAFAASSAAKGKSILLIDDVFTTGATMNECAKALKRAGAAKVYAAAVCSAGGDREE